MSKADLYIAIVGGSESMYSAGAGISILSASGQAIAGVVSAVAPVGGAIAVNPAAGFITLVKIGIDVDLYNQVNVGDALSVVGNSVSVIAAVCAVVPGGQPLAIGLGVIGRAMTLAGIGLSLLDVNYRINPTVNTTTTSAINWTPPRDPLVLDLDGGGITTSGINPAAPILFDHDGDGTKTASGWIASGEALVVRDINGNGNGTIDTGRELFGDSTILTRGPNAGKTAANGFEALADLDSNGDGKFSSLDTAYSSVKLWKDANQDGISQTSELFTLNQLGVASINTTGTASNINLGGGNTQVFSGSFTRTNGTTGNSGAAELAGSLLLANNNFYREFTDDPTPTAEALALPHMTGSGAVRDLSPAMSLGTAQANTLQTTLTQFAQGTTRDQQIAKLDALIQSWGNTSAMQTSVQTNRTAANFGGANPPSTYGATAIEKFLLSTFCE